MTATQHTVMADGIKLHVESEGRGHPVVLLHGFTGTTRSMARLACGLRDAHRVIRIDLIGHGTSEAPHDVAHYTMERCVAQVVAALDTLDVSHAHLLGYSMGGRTALALCTAHSDRFSSALLIGASAGLEDAAARSARVRDDEAVALRIERDGVASFIDEWMALPLFASMQSHDAEALAASRADRLRNTAHGLANSLRGMGSGAQPPLHAKLLGLHLPVLLVAGELDPKFRRIAADLALRLPAAEVETLPGAGHAALFERPDAVIKLALRFFRDVDHPNRDTGRIEQTDRVVQTDPEAQTTSETAAAPKHHDPPHSNPPARSPVQPEDPQAMSREPARDAGPVNWKIVHSYEDIRFEKSDDGIAKVTINRPNVRNAFRPKTVFELIDAFSRVREDPEVGVVLFTGEGREAFCSGGDQKVRGDSGYIGDDGVPRLNVLDLQKLIRSLPKPVIALVAGYAIGGGHILHLISDITIAAENARFGQTGPKVGSFDGGFGAGYMARIVGQKKAREIWFLCRQYDAKQALDMGLVNEVVSNDDLEATGVQWAREILCNSPIAIRCLKASLNADLDGQAGIQELAGNATMLFYMTEEGQEGRNAFIEKRDPDFSKYPWRP